MRGARAIDVGASTGGFTEALLAHGARQRLAVDVGHGQLHASLRADARVDDRWRASTGRRCRSTSAPGPFDFFTVDVSFVAARNMLRGLAFRLRAGAEGVVLVKPQFELPERRRPARPQRRRRRSGDLREAALEKVRGAGARGSGFTVVEHCDSPVAGGSGTIEVLAHLRFAGGPTTMPQPGERKRAAKPQRRATRRAGRRARCAGSRSSRPGWRRSTAREVGRAARGVAEVRAVDRRRRAGPARREAATARTCGCASRRACSRASARSRRASSASCATAPPRCPGSAFVAPGRVGRGRARARSRCRLYHTGALAETAALAHRRRRCHGRARRRSGDEDADVTRAGARRRGSLHVQRRRLGRAAAPARRAQSRRGAAPLRETLAAGLLALAGWDPATRCVDPMCGAGTIVDRGGDAGAGPGARRRPSVRDRATGRFAAGAAIAPRGDAARRGARRALAAARTDARRSSAPIATRARSRARAATPSAPGVARSSRSPAASSPTRARPRRTGLVIANPPYGRRLGDPRAAGCGYRELGRVLRAHFRGWRAGVLVATPPRRAIRMPIADRCRCATAAARDAARSRSLTA